MTEKYIYWDGNYIPKEEFEHDVLGTKLPQDKYKIPPRIQMLKNKLMLLQSRMDDLVEERRKAIKELKKFQDKAIMQHQYLQNILNHTNNRLHDTETDLKEVYQLLREEMKHL